MKLWLRFWLGAAAAFLAAAAAHAQSLSITGLSASPSSARPGDQITFSLAVSNSDPTTAQAAGNVESFEITLTNIATGYSFTMSAMGTAATAIPAASGTPSTPGTGTVTVTVTLPPQSTEAGSYRASARATDGSPGAFGISTSVLSVTGTPDFQITNLVYPSGTSYVGGDVIPMTITYVNRVTSNGFANVPYVPTVNGASFFRIQVVLSSNPVYGDADDFRLTFHDISLKRDADGVGVPITWDQVLPGNFSGSYYVLAKIDALDGTSETIENDLSQNAPTLGNNIWLDVAATRIAIQPSNFPTVYLASTTGSASGNGYSDNPSITADGRYTAFASDAFNLVSGDTNAARDIFLFDNQNALVRRLNLSQQGAQANANSNNPALAGNGRYVAFSSAATNLIVGDVNGFEDIFIVDTLTGAISLQSVSAAGVQANGSSFRPAVSHTGRYLVFESSATNLVAGGTTPGITHVYLRDRDVSGSGTFDTPGNTSTTLVDVSGATAGNANATQGQISADGRYVAFASRATNLAAGATTAGRQHIYVRDLTAGTTTIVSIGTGGVEANADSRNPSINRNTGVAAGVTADGRYIAFGSEATNLVAADTNGVSDVFVYDRVAATTIRASVSTADAQATDPTDTAVTGSRLGSLNPSISATGRYVVFASLANNLARGDAVGQYVAGGSGNGSLNIYVRDRDVSDNGTYDTAGDVLTTNVSVNRFGYQSLRVLGVQSTAAADIFPVISADGRWVAFPFDAEGASGLVHSTTNQLSPDANTARDVVVFDRRTNQLPGSATPPTVSITNPGAGSSALVNTAINVTASATTTTGVVSTVQFFVNGVSIGSSAVFPYSATWTPTAVGSYTLSALVTDSFGNIGVSPNITVAINAAPSVGITAPTASATITAGTAQTITAVAAASNPGATIASVQFFVNGSALGTAVISAPFSTAWTPAAAGTYNLTAVATDSLGTQTTSPVVALTVTAPGGGGGGPGVTPPTVSIAAPASGSTIALNTAQTVTATATAPGGAVTRVDFFANGAPIGSATTFPYAVQWTPTTPGTYALTATATDQNGTQATSTAASVTAAVGTAPTIAIITPTNGATIAAGRAQSITANASASTGNVVSVAFSANGTAIGSDPTFPYAVAWTPAGPGTYVITATATDSTGNQATSTISVTATGTVPAAPTVAVTTPTAGAVITVNTPQTLIASASSTGATIDSVDFFANGVLVGNDATFPYALTWTPTAVGNYTLTAVAKDSFGSQTTSAAVAVSVAAGSTSQPSVFLNATPTGSTVAVNSPVFIGADADDPDGTIASVEFYANSQLVGSVGAAPYLVSWTPTTPGNYSITAVVTDNAGNRVTSTASTITAAARVGVLPVAALGFSDPSVDTPTGSSPTPAPTLTPVRVSFGSRLLISAGAVDQDGSIANVQFFANGTSIGTVGAAPFYTAWQLNTLSDVVLTAIVTDSAGNSVFTNPVLIETVPSVAAAVSSVVLVSPLEGATYAAGRTIIFSATHNFGTVTPPKIDFYVNGSQFTTVSAAPYQANLGLTRAGVYQVHAVARSGTIVTVSEPVRIVVTSNSAPVIAITSPLAGNSFVVGAGLTIATSASDPDGTIQSVQFYVNGSALSSDNAAPYTAAWNPGAAGTYTLTALATDEAGNQTLSSPVVVTMNGNNAPTVTISTPASGTVSTAGTAVQLGAAAADADGTVASVRFLANGTVVGSATAVPFSVTWTPSASGTYTVIAQATDNSGNVTSSTPITVTVSSNRAPVISLTSPGNGSAVRVGAGTTLTATASDPDGTITNVQFFANGVAVGAADTTPPYSVTWSPTAEGIYRLTATTLDNSGSATTSSTTTVLVVATGASDVAYSGTYAGLGETGRFALINAGGRTAAFIGFSTTGTPRTYFFPSLPVDNGGGFSSFDGAGRSIIAGSASETGVAGTVDNNRLTFIGPAGFGGTGTAPVGYYTGNLMGRMGSTVSAIVGQDGSLTVHVTDGTFRDAGAGTLGSNGTFSVNTVSGARITGTLDPASGFLSGSMNGSSGGSFMAALASGVSFSDGFLRNLSTRGQVGTGANILIAGFVVGGSTPKQVLVRAIGPSLTQFGVNGALSNPQLQLFTGNTLVATNDNWGGDAAILNASNQAGAFPLSPSSLDSVLLLTLAPGSYTAQVSGIGGATGVALVELYDIDNLSPFSTQKVMNVATRGVVGSDQAQLIAGFVVSGNTSKKILVRAVGPTLANPPFNVPGTLADPILRIVRSDGTIVRENDNWEAGNDPALITGASTRVSAFALAGGSRDAAILISLPPGSYTAQVTGAGTSTGVALVEVYEVP
jgi:hypothetical protein